MWFLVVSSLQAQERGVAFAGAGFGQAEIKSILKNVVERNSGQLQYDELGEAAAPELCTKYAIVVLATSVAHPYTAEEVEQLEAYIRGGGRLLIIQQAYRSMSEEDGKPSRHFDSWLGTGRSHYFREGASCIVNKPDDPLLANVFTKNQTPSWLHATVLLKNPDFENLVGLSDAILVGRKRIGEGAVYYVGSELFRMLLPQYPERHADAESWVQLLENILTDTSKE